MSRRTAIVTGSTSGIGHAIAGRLHADGFNVVITGRDEARGGIVRAELGDNAAFVGLDLTVEGAAAQLAEATLERFGRIDVVVNNAAQDHTGDLLNVPVDEIRHAFAVNAIAPITVLQETAKRMDGGGAIINISSRLATIGVPTMSIYSATKGAINALTTAAAVELADRNIRVNAVAPGMTRTPLYDAWLGDQDDPARTEHDVVSGIPLKRLAVPGDVAAAVSFLASEGAAYITGVCIPIDGGYTAR
ncbi:NAD(P)-dependent dehydrogenase (short-subunit alcohol dehydrogenase family) [Mycobacterium frederiksbergense]|uniref:NAD(P)-dependent dehydrogenase (Short-subunit alcohol dehydrogenase family) n=1 Tax=Mycolicibacterium frederiksbergense TaxID=117567 RepID=A0ABT6KYW6_9MYCO|nr:glucose 1-dehydrogenase [Mycolicibacterium frederiksbergense]MDH6195511.1 NAD(P)-dependent dehydrogenase (short-subunit alcohol dehydrogenase family) [Mycolicibacterium frederiksbergense]